MELQKLINMRCRFQNIAIIFIVGLSFIVYSRLSAQNNSVIPCYTDQMRKMHGFIQPDHEPMNKTEFTIEDTDTYYIPIVFHIIYTTKGTGADQLTDADIQSQIKVLNEDYSKMPGTHGYNNYNFGADTKIRFYLATKDPYGNPTTGIERIQNTTDNISSADEMAIKNLSRWNQLYYFNVWIVSQIDGSNRIAGYSYLPQDVATATSAQDIDGTVINYLFVGKNTGLYNDARYQLARTLTHEAGHYFNLHHPWGDEDINVCGDDGVDDTPPCENIYFSNYPPPYYCDSPFQCGHYRLVEDYMDYSDDRCMDVFTKGQSKKMRAALRQYRPNLISCPNRERTGAPVGCGLTSVENTNTINIVPNPADAADINFKLFLDHEQSLDFYIYDQLGNLLQEQLGIRGAAGTFTMHLPGLRTGIYYGLVKGQTQVFRKRILIATH